MDLQEQNNLINSRPYTIAIDIDGCLAKYIGWQGPDRFGEVSKFTLHLLEKRIKKHPNLKIIIHTCRVLNFNDNSINPEYVKCIETWLKQNNIPYNEIWTKLGKPFANEYWDDNALKVRFDSMIESFF